MARWRRWSNGRSAELVGVAPSIARCGEGSRVGGRGLVAQSRVGTASVVVGDPAREAGPGVVETEEQRLVQKLVTHAPVEALADAVLHRLAWRDEVPGDAVLACPAEYGVRGELGSVVGDDHRRSPPAAEKRSELACDPRAPRSRCRQPRRGTPW